MYWANHYWGMHLFWWIFWVVALLVVVSWAWSAQPKHRDRAIDELRRAYATGTINEEEYRHRLAVLTEQRERDKHSRAAA